MRPLGACVFAGIVQQDAHRLTQLCFVALHGEVGLDVAFQRQSALKKGDRFKRQHSAPDRVA